MNRSDTAEDAYHSSPGTVKRSLDTSDGPARKKAHIDGTEHLSVKILVPSQAVGAIIGKGGEVMRSMKTEYQCSVQMSKTGSTYPGTSERICQIRGRLDNVMAVVANICEKIYDKCSEVSPGDAFDAKDYLRGQEVKIVMPNTSAGLVIGKSGANIKEIREQFDCAIQVHPKAGSQEALASNERVVVIAHENQERLLAAAQKVLEKVTTDPNHSSVIDREDNKPFSGVPASAAYPNLATYVKSSGSSTGLSPLGGGSSASFTSPPVRNLQSHGLNFGNNECLHFLDCLQHVLRDSGFASDSVTEIMGAMQILAKYNIMSVGLGFGVQALSQMRPQQQAPSSYASNHGTAGFGTEHFSSTFWQKR